MAREFLPFLRAARRGLLRSRWQFGNSVDDLLAPVVLAVLAEVGKIIPKECACRKNDSTKDNSVAPASDH